MNALNMNLSGRVVLLDGFEPEYKRYFLVEEGFGAKPDTVGRAIYGRYLHDGRESTRSGMDVLRAMPFGFEKNFKREAHYA